MDPPAPIPMRLHMRSRPGMYIGGLNPRGLRHMLDDVVCEQLAAPGASPERVRCTVGDDGTYSVDVRGGRVAVVVPVDFDPEAISSKSWNEGFFSLAIVNAFSDRLDAEVVRDGRRWTQSLAAGVSLGPAEVAASTAPPLVRIRYRPDPALFKPGVTAGFLPLCARTQEWAAFHPNTRFAIDDEASGQRRDYHYPAGLLSLAEESTDLHHADRVWRCATESDDGSAAEVVIINRIVGGRFAIRSFVNGRATTGDGTHVDGLRRGLAGVAASYDPDDNDNPFLRRSGDDPLAGLSVLLAVRLKEPTYADTTKTELESPQASDLVRRMIVGQLRDEIARMVVERVS